MDSERLLDWITKSRRLKMPESLIVKDCRLMLNNIKEDSRARIALAAQIVQTPAVSTVSPETSSTLEAVPSVKTKSPSKKKTHWFSMFKEK